MIPTCGGSGACSDFSSTHRRLGKKVLEMQGVEKSYDGRPVAAPFSYSFRSGERIGIIGPNGSGKTTFLRWSRETPRTRGRVIKRGNNRLCAPAPGQRGGSPRHHRPGLHERAGGTGAAGGRRSRFPSSCSWSGFSFPARCTPSAGPPFRRRVAAAHSVRLLATAPNFLLLDEPTNDLDLDTIRLLENYLADFAGLHPPGLP